MKILLTGSSSFFSKEFIKYVGLNKKIKLFCITRKKLKMKNIKYWKLDLSKKKLSKFPQKKKFDLVVHSSFVRMKKKNDIKIIEDNFNITKNLIKILNKNYFKKFINLSSASLYPNKDGKFSEKSDVFFLENNDNMYGFSKYMAEKMLNLHLNKHKTIHFRVGNIIGNDQDKSIVSEIKKSLKSRNCIEIFGNGERVLNLIHITNLIKYIFLIFKQKTYGVFNLCDYSISIKKLAQIIKNKYGNKKSKILFKKLNIKNSKFNLITNKFFNLIKSPKPTNKGLLYEI
jgi:nucleoside-diphosphate-sugar epimerase